MEILSWDKEIEKMKKISNRQYVVLGLGIFGSTVAKTLSSYNCEVIALDNDEKCVDRMADIVTQSMMCDITAVSYTHLDVYKRQRFDRFAVFLCQYIDTSLQLQPVIYLVSLKHFHRFIINHGMDAVHIMLDVRQSAFLCLPNPFLTVAILGKQNTGMLAQNIAADIQ